MAPPKFPYTAGVPPSPHTALPNPTNLKQSLNLFIVLLYLTLLLKNFRMTLKWNKYIKVNKKEGKKRRGKIKRCKADNPAIRVDRASVSEREV